MGLNGEGGRKTDADAATAEEQRERAEEGEAEQTPPTAATIVSPEAVGSVGKVGTHARNADVINVLPRCVCWRRGTGNGRRHPTSFPLPQPYL